MNKLFLATTFLIVSSTSFAATTGVLLLQGTVAQKISLVVTPQSIASTLDLSTSQTDLVVASVTEQSNSKSGHKLTITSANLGKLKRTDGNDVFAYSMKYNGSTIAVTSVAGAMITNSSSTPVNSNKSVTISYSGVAPELMVEGTYADTITFTIAAN